MNPVRSLAAVLTLMAVLAACGAPEIGDRAEVFPAAVNAPREATVVIGSVGDDAVEEVEAFQPFADALAKRLEGAGVQQGRVIVAPSMAEMSRLMDIGEVDLLGYVFTEDDENTLFWVMEGRAEAGAMSENELRELAADDFDALRVLATSAMVPRQIVVRARHLTPDRVTAMQTALTTMHDDATGVAVLADFQGTTRFELLDEQTSAQLSTLISQVPSAPATG